MNFSTTYAHNIDGKQVAVIERWTAQMLPPRVVGPLLAQTVKADDSARIFSHDPCVLAT